jgi:hypothetical protein
VWWGRGAAGWNAAGAQLGKGTACAGDRRAVGKERGRAECGKRMIGHVPMPRRADKRSGDFFLRARERGRADEESG